MKLILRSKTDNNFISISIKTTEPYDSFLEKLKNDLVHPTSGIIIIYDEQISSYDLAKIKRIFEKLQINNFKIYSNSRETISTAKFLKINSTFIKNKKDFENELNLNSTNKIEHTVYKGTVRSGNRISSNGDLYVAGDVNPGAIVSAKGNIYVWGKLLGIASAGEDGNTNASIASLYLNPLQLRISEIIAVGPKEKPKNQHPEIAVIENQTIIIKPYLIGT